MASQPISGYPPPLTFKDPYSKFFAPPTKIPRPSPTFSNTQEIVTFHVCLGHRMQTFLVYKEVAARYSPVLRAALNSDFLEGQTQTYKLEDVEPEVFRLMVQWLHRQEIEYYFTQDMLDSLDPTPSYTEEQDQRKLKLIHDKIEERQPLLVRLWVLADRLVVPRLQNLVVDELESIRRTWNTVAWNWLPYVCDNTVELELDKDERERILSAYVGSPGVWADLSDRRDFRKYFHVPVESEGDDEDETDGSPGVGEEREEVMEYPDPLE